MTEHHQIKDPQTPSEERFNVATHALGLTLSLVGLGAMLAWAYPLGFWALTACSVYGASLVLLFGSSTFYHACPHGVVKRRARVIDHCMILVLIAGSYTPFMALGVGGWKGWSLLALVWTLAFLGIRHKFTSPNPFGAASVALCLVMGWLITLVWHPLTASLGPGALAWLVAGGLCYTLGVPFYALRNLLYNHGIWHLFVLAGAACHYRSVLSLL